MEASDPIADILQTMRLTGGIFLEASFIAPWCVLAKVGPEDCGRFVPVPRSIIAFHFVYAGRLSLQIDGQPPVSVAQGELVLLPRNDAHRIGSDLSLAPVSADSLIQPGASGGLARIDHGGGDGEATRMFCGFLGTDRRNDPVLALLPPVMKLDFADDALGAWIESSLKFAARQVAPGSPHSPAVLARLAEALFVGAVQRYCDGLATEDSGWLGAARDTKIARALALIHGQIGRQWTADDIARQIGMSRSAFAERFTRIIGESPIRYLAHYRLHLASQQLAQTDTAIPRIALAVGYESEAAFSRAFKRTYGVPPAKWRKQRKPPNALRQRLR